MRHFSFLLAAIACGSFAACAGSGDPQLNVLSSSSSASGAGGGESSGSGDVTPPSASDAKTFFVQEIHPSLLATCGDCHITGPGLTFLADDGAVAYDLAMKAPGIVLAAKSRLLLKGEHAGDEAPALTSKQADIVVQWLAKEFEGGDGDPPIDDDPLELTPLQQLQAFAQCMSYADWEKYEVHRLAQEDVIYQNNPVPCDSCHAEGQSGAYISNDSIAFFNGTKKMPYLFKLANATLNEDGSFKDVVSSNRFVEKCVEKPMIGNIHPPCQNGQIDTAVIESIQLFFDATKARWKDGKCDEATAPPEVE
jgi:hypothetical protein